MSELEAANQKLEEAISKRDSAQAALNQVDAVLRERAQEQRDVAAALAKIQYDIPIGALVDLLQRETALNFLLGGDGPIAIEREKALKKIKQENGQVDAARREVQRLSDPGSGLTPAQIFAIEHRRMTAVVQPSGKPQDPGTRSLSE